jgi:hypothetical protein
VRNLALFNGAVTVLLTVYALWLPMRAPPPSPRYGRPIPDLTAEGPLSAAFSGMSNFAQLAMQHCLMMRNHRSGEQ